MEMDAGPGTAVGRYLSVFSRLHCPTVHWRYIDGCQIATPVDGGLPHRDTLDAAAETRYFTAPPARSISPQPCVRRAISLICIKVDSHCSF